MPAVLERDAAFLPDRRHRDDGVRLRPLGSAPLPDAFRLVVPLEKIDADCVVIWRKGADVGVRLVK